VRLQMRLYRWNSCVDRPSWDCSGAKSGLVGLIASCASCAFFALLLQSQTGTSRLSSVLRGFRSLYCPVGRLILTPPLSLLHVYLDMCMSLEMLRAQQPHLYTRGSGGTKSSPNLVWTARLIFSTASGDICRPSVLMYVIIPSPVQHCLSESTCCQMHPHAPSPMRSQKWQQVS
jgi:hypothetical protein